VRASVRAVFFAILGIASLLGKEESAEGFGHNLYLRSVDPVVWSMMRDTAAMPLFDSGFLGTNL
jgi:hypothetical protein